jgi:ribonuclease HI
MTGKDTPPADTEEGAAPSGENTPAPEAPKTPRRGAAILAEKWGASHSTTNNRMELTAVISALEALPFILEQGCRDPERITVYTDSQYVQKGITQWIHGWKRNNWRTGGKEPVKNQDLWRRLDTLAAGFRLTWAWVRGHAGNAMNERCDRMTQEAIRSLR